ncbi:hypothetical protein EK21DRAFT_83549 [Setomelanomma holmii]|uniref:Uncharacterized protein n=1 Tax=Setomelanomma holmii TaxID=210430 RepID=A0A9P4HJW8_9PLEO|nr:hypothetical protein EK21DRAFT_83549 [Setomelanomma holmii]
MAEIIGVVGSIVQIIGFVSAGLSDVRGIDLLPSKGLWEKIREDGLIVTLLVRTVFRDAYRVMEMVERYVVHADGRHVLGFMKSYTSSFNMIGVAGAIIAQVAISAMSLTRLEDSHWTAQAFLVASLTTGALSVFFSCAASPAFHGLHSADDIKDFLTKPTPSARKAAFRAIVRRAISLIEEHQDKIEEEHIKVLRDAVEEGRWKVASPYAALMLVAPMFLLQIALSTFLTGLGIYLGKVVTARLIPEYGSGSIAILVFYLASALFGLSIFFGPQGVKQLDDIWLTRWKRVLVDYKIFRSNRPPVNATDGMEEEQGRSDSSSQAPSQHSSTSSQGRDGDGEEYIAELMRPRNQQSVHSRNGSKVHYTINEAHDPSTKPEPKPEMKNVDETTPPFYCTTDSIPDHVPEADRLKPASPDPSPTLTQDNQTSVLLALIKAQEESLQATRRLLELHTRQTAQCWMPHG